MGRNMIIRLGVDASDFTKKMERAGALSKSVGDKIRNALDTGGFVGGRKLVAEMTTALNTVRAATENIDLTTPLSEQIKKMVGEREKLQKEYDKVTKRYNEVTMMPVADTDLAREQKDVKRTLLWDEADNLKSKIDSVSERIAALQNAADNIGSEFLQFASNDALKTLSDDIEISKKAILVYKDSLMRAADAEQRTAEEAERLAQAVDSPRASLSELIQDFRKIGSAAGKLNPIAGIFRRIKDSAGGSNNSLEKMVRTIRNVSVVSFGLKIARSLFGELESVTRDYISQNAALQAQVNGLKSSLGQALAPAIHLVSNALSYVLPYVVGVSNAIGQLMGALFGTGWSAAAAGANKTAAATGSAAKAQKEMNRQLLSFDQINRMDSQQDTSSGGGGGSGSAVSPIEAKTPAWAEHLRKTFTDLFESAEFQAANTGGKIGMILNTAVGEATSALAHVDFSGAGSVLAQNFNSMIGAINWDTAGQLLGMAMVALPSVAVGFIQTADWPLVGQSVSQFLMSSLGTVSEWIRSVDWLQIGVALGTFIANVDWPGITQSFGSALGAALGAVGAVLWGMIKEPWASFSEQLRANMELAGGDAAAGFFWTLGEAIANVGVWLVENFCKPIIDGVKAGFGIHSPSTAFASIGESCMTGLSNGFTTGMDWIQQKLEDLKSRVLNAAETLKSAFSFEWSLPHLRLPHLQVEWDPVDSVLANFFGVTAFPRLSVQWFAKGGILNGAQIFGAMGSTLLGGGERGREAILPLDTNTEWMDVLANRIAQTISTEGGDVNATIRLELDGEVLTTYVMKGLRRRSRAGTASI